MNRFPGYDVVHDIDVNRRRLITNAILCCVLNVALCSFIYLCHPFALLAAICWLVILLVTIYAVLCVVAAFSWMR